MMKSILFSISLFICMKSVAVDRTYPVSEVNIGAHNTAFNLNITGFASGSALNIYTPNGVENEDWRINYISAGVYEIENSTTGLLITVGADNVARIASKVNNNTQRWQIVGVTKDFLGEFLYYKIVNVGNGKALTYIGASVTTQAFTSAENQLWRLDLDGLEGFGAMCKVNEGTKASTIGGLLGPTVFVNNLTDLRTELGRSGPLTVVLTANLNCINQGNDIRIDSYKTLIGSFSANTLTDARLVTNYYGWSNPPANPGPPSDNIVIKNLTFPVQGREDVIVLQVYSGKNVWIDHNTFYSNLSKAVDEVGKFIWINTSSAGPDQNRNPDFITLSYNVLRNRYWCVAYGTQNSTVTEDRTTVAFNLWDSNVRRTPQIGNGTMHTYNNFNVNNSSSVENAGYANVIPGDGSFVYSEANRFENFKKESSGYWDQEFVLGSRPFKDVGSYTNKSESGSSSVTPYLWTTTLSLPVLNWNPRTNYGYKVLKAYNSSGQNDAKAFNQLYSGSKGSQTTFKYVTDADLSNYVVETVPHPGLISIVRDCNGDINGTAVVDECGVCSGGNTGVVACYKDCEGVIDGTAVVDECGVCTGGTTGVVSCSGAMEAEDFCSAAGIQEDKNDGFMGASYLNLDNALGTSASWYLYSESTQNVQIGIRFANGSMDARGYSVAVNGSIQTNLVGAVTGSWTTWNTEIISLNLAEGPNQITVTSLTTVGAPNIDLFSFYNASVYAARCTADCNGVLGGIAYMDNCNTCVGGTTSKEACQQDCTGEWGGTAQTDACGVCLTDVSIQPCAGSLEAEEACILDGTVDNNNAGFSGVGFANTTNALGSKISWILNSDINQTATISFRYANGGSASRGGTITINGNAAGELILNPTGSWTTWEMASMNLGIENGANEITITATTADGLANLDLVTFSSGISDSQCGVITGNTNNVNESLFFYPNPTNGILNLSQSASWKLMNTQGSKLKQGKGNEVDLSDCSAGIYFLQLDYKIHKIIKE